MLVGNDFDNIRAVVVLYLEGMIWGQPDKLVRAFHPKATAAGHDLGAFFNSPRDEFIPDWMKLATLPAGTPYAAALVSIDITGDIAVVKVTNTCFSDDYTDYLTLIKTDGRWQIAHKAWFTHPKPPETPV